MPATTPIDKLSSSPSSNATTTSSSSDKTDDGPPPGWFQHERIIQSRLTKEDFRRVADARRSM